MFDVLDETNFILFASHYYDNEYCVDVDEFYEDLNRIKYIKRLFKKYAQKGELKERLILNHIVILYNVFEHHALNRMLLYKLEGYDEYLFPFLLYLGYIKESEASVLNQGIIDALRNI